MTPDQIAAEIAEKAELAIELRNFWHMFSDANPFDGSADFPARMEAVGFCELCNVTDDDLEEAFAYERGIEPGGQVWKLTAIGKKIVEANNSGYAVATVCEADRAALLDKVGKMQAALQIIANQATTFELKNEPEVKYENLDFEGALDYCIDAARAALEVKP